MYSIHNLAGKFHIYRYGEPYLVVEHLDIAEKIVSLLKQDHNRKVYGDVTADDCDYERDWFTRAEYRGW